jgi:hypothetical protein
MNRNPQSWLTSGALNLLAIACLAADDGPRSPATPKVFLQTSVASTPVTGKTIKVDAGGNLQKALDSAKPGDEVVLQAGASFTGNFVLPKKEAGDGWIVVRTSDMQSLPSEGHRVLPENAAAMPKLLSPSTAAAIVTAAGASHYRLIGIEVTTSPEAELSYCLVSAGSGRETEINALPSAIILDRMYIHGNAHLPFKRGVQLNGCSCSVIDSYISDIHVEGQDTQAIAIWNGCGPFKIVNNYLEAAGENVMFGGADPKIVDLVPSDVEFRNNYCFKPLTWRIRPGGPTAPHWTVKNSFETKNARRLLVDQNVFENCWTDAQTGFAILLKSENQDGAAPWTVTEDFTFSNNLVRNSGSAIKIAGHTSGPAKTASRFLIRNNRFEQIGKTDDGILLILLAGVTDVTFDHNTGFQSGAVIIADGAAMPGLTFTNNISPHNQYGVKGSGQATGIKTLEAYFPGCQFLGNVLIGGNKSLYPAGNLFPATAKEINFSAESTAVSLPAEFAKAGAHDLPDWEAIRVGVSQARGSQ